MRLRPQMIQTGSNSGQSAYRASRGSFPVRFRTGKAPLPRYCPNRRSRGKYDPSRGGGGGPGRPVTGRGDRAVPPGFAGAAGWRPAVGAAALSAGSARRSIGAPGHNDDRSRTPGHSRPPGRTAAAGALRRSPCSALPAGGDKRDSAGQSRPHPQMPFLPSAALNARPFYPGNMGE